MIPFWKKALSWVYPFNIEKVHSEISGTLEVNLQYGNLVVDTEKANYSFGNLHIVFQEAIQSLDLKHHKNYKVLILGFGAGSIANILVYENQLNCSITGIELDPEIIKLSKKYFFLNLSNKTTIHNIDALTFAKHNTEQYDLVFVDLFVDTKIPTAFQKEPFLQQVKKALLPNGIVLMNSMEQAEELAVNWQKTFHSKDFITIQDNKVLKFINKK